MVCKIKLCSNNARSGRNMTGLTLYKHASGDSIYNAPLLANAENESESHL